VAREEKTADRITLRDLIEAGLIRAPLKVEKTYRGKKLTATIEADGTIAFLGKSYTSPSTAGGVARAHVLGGHPRATNGWDFWTFTDKGGQRSPIKTIRERYVQSRKSALPS